MADAEKISSASNTKMRLGLLAVALSTLCFAGALVFFLAKGKIVLGIDFGYNKELWGWTLMLISAFLSMLGLTAAITMSK